MRTRTTALALACLALAPAEGAAQGGLAEVARTELNPPRTGIVAGLYHEGRLDFLDAWGTASPADSQALSPRQPFPFPELTEVLIALTVRALVAGRVVDDQAPIATYLRGLPPRLGAVTLDQLLTHTAGLDDAEPLEGLSWEEAIDRLPDEALFTAPGLVYSHSRYSYPLAARVLERVADMPLEELIGAAVLAPLRMERTTFDLASALGMGMVGGSRMNGDSARLVEVPLVEERQGLPVVFTTVPDVIQLVAALRGGAIPGRSPLAPPSAEDAPADTTGARGPADKFPAGPARFLDGFWLDRFRGVPRATRFSSALGFGAGVTVLPESETIFVAWATGVYPSVTSGFVLDGVAEALGLPPPPPPARPDPEAPGPAHPAAWAGTYRNGEFIIVLAWEEGRLLFFDGDRNLEVTPLAEDLLAAREDDGRIAVTMRLVEAGERRFVVVRNRAYALQPPEDAPGG